MSATDKPAEERHARSDFAWFMQMPTRWIDNDLYGHMNNALYYSVYENVVMSWLELEKGLNPNTGNVRCFTAENGCRYLSAVKYPDVLDCGLRVAHLGNSSVRYELGIFVAEREPIRAMGHIIDVFVDASTERPIRIPDEFRQALGSLQVTG